MNNWAAVGGICFCVAVVLLLAGVGLGFSAISAIEQNPLSGYLGSYGSQIKNQVFISASTPYFVGSGVMFVIGIAGMFVGSAKTEQVSAVSKEPLPEAVGVSHITCGRCGTLNDLDAVYCKKCSQQFR